MTTEELTTYGLPATFDEDMRRDCEEIRDAQIRRALSVITDPKQFRLADIDIGGWPGRYTLYKTWLWFKAIASLIIDYRVPLWAHDCVDVAVWDVTSSVCDYDGHDWTELAVRHVWKFGYDIYGNSSY